MNSRRKADLQRKLTLASVPKPPAGLAERIKSDIPSYLHPEADRRRMSRSINFSMRIAASILLVVASVVGVFYLLEPEAEMQVASKTVPPAGTAPAPQPTLADRVMASAPTETVHLEITEEAKSAAPVTQIADAALDVPRPAPLRAEMRRERADDEGVEGGVEGRVMGGVAGGTVGGVIGGTRATEPPAQIAEVAPAPVAAAEGEYEYAPVPPAAPAPEPAPSAPARAKATYATPSLVKEAQAADLSFAQKQSAFGISTDAAVFERIKTTLESGQRPQASSVNVEALVNYFAGAPAKPRRRIELAVEGSPAPVQVQGKRGILRFTIDTPSTTETPRPVATDARIEIEFDKRAVASAKRVGDEEGMAGEAALLQNFSVTGLYELELHPMTASQRVATVRLRYRSPETGKQRTIEKVLRGRDFAKQWTQASRRHRLASLGAVWGESLKGMAGGVEVAQRANELATQEPNDTRAGELARLAAASSKLRPSTPTGSGR